MKKIILITSVLLFAASTVFAADFSPTLLRLSAPELIEYDFDGTDLPIPVKVTGSPATTIFFVYTKDKGETIGPVQNGFLGWHYVNMIDTCMYISGTPLLDEGNNTIIWDGKNTDGNAVSPGEYTYYLWAYDSVSSKIMACYTHGGYNSGEFLSHDEDGTPKTRPAWHFGANGTSKWIIGRDPSDTSQLETTLFDVPGGANIHLEFHPDDHSKVFALFKDVEGTLARVRKFEWVPNGISILQEDWGDNGEYIFSNFEGWSAIGGVQRIGDVLFISNAHYYSDQALAELHYIDLEEGYQVREVDISDWWVEPDDMAAGAQLNGGPYQLYEQNGYLYGSDFCACLRGAFDPLREDDEDISIWYNGNGDYIGDHNFEEDADKPWVCRDYNVAPYAYISGLDEHFFSGFGAFDLGAISFGLIAPDGTGVSYLSVAGETAISKDGPLFIDYGSAYDGMYTGARSTGAEDFTAGLWFLGHDSIKGVITSEPVAVDESAPSAFSVAQNSPNPFNPTTTISFTTADAGNVTIDVFNVAGQKVDTIASEFMSAGSHSVTWDAIGFSAGIYFYTVKSGDFSRTLKMTLLK